MKIARLNSEGRVVEIMDLENPRKSLHPDVLAQCVDATKETEIGDCYENQKFSKREPQLNEFEIEERKRNEAMNQAMNELREVDLEKIKDKTTREILSRVFILLGVST